MKKQSLVEGAFILTVASLITRVLIFSNTIVESRVLGPDGIGLKKLVMPYLEGVIMTFTITGLPAAISKLLAEATAHRNRTKVQNILAVSFSIATRLSIGLVFLFILGGKLFLHYFLTDPCAYYAFMTLIPIIPIAAVSGVLTGYFRGLQNMNPVAIAQVMAQIVQVGLTYLLVKLLMPWGLEYAAGAVLSGVTGEACSLIFLIIIFRISQRQNSRPSWLLALSRKSVLFELLQTGLPTTGNGFIISLFRALQPVVITKSLAVAGMRSAMITRQFGMLAGFVMPLGFLPDFINQSLEVTLVPAISEANAQNNLQLIQHRLNQGIGVALIVGAPSCVLMYLFASQLMSMLYHAPAATPLLRLIAPFFLFNYLQTPLHSALVGIGQAKTVMFNNIIAKCATVALIYFLVAIQKLGITGAIIAISIGLVLETILQFSTVMKATAFAPDIPLMFKIISAGIVMGLSARSVLAHLNNTASKLGYPIIFLVSILVSLLLYVILLGFLKVIRRHDIERIPGIGKILAFLVPS